MAGIGGVSRQKTYRIPHLTYRIGQGEATIEDVHVSTGLDLRTGQPVGEMLPARASTCTQASPLEKCLASAI